MTTRTVVRSLAVVLGVGAGLLALPAPEAKAHPPGYGYGRSSYGYGRSYYGGGGYYRAPVYGYGGYGRSYYGGGYGRTFYQPQTFGLSIAPGRGLSFGYSSGGVYRYGGRPWGW